MSSSEVRDGPLHAFVVVHPVLQPATALGQGDAVLGPEHHHPVEVLDREIDGVRDDIAGAGDEGAARRLIERMAVTWGASLLVRHGDPDVAAAYVSSRLGGDWGSEFGTLASSVATADIARRAVPA